jgi:hypothetical protein
MKELEEIQKKAHELWKIAEEANEAVGNSPHDLLTEAMIARDRAYVLATEASKKAEAAWAEACRIKTSEETK